MEQRSLAFHEAGHSIIGRALGILCGHATIEADHDSGAHAMVPDQWSIFDGWWEDEGRYHREMPAVFHARIITVMAGCEAEKELLGKMPSGADDDDCRQVAIMLEELGLSDDGLRRMEKRLRAFTRQLVRRHRATIGETARRLAFERTINAESLDGMMGEATRLRLAEARRARGERVPREHRSGD
jgi:hypothetical protein